MGKTCEPKAFSFQCMTEFTTNKKKKKKYIRIILYNSNEHEKYQHHMRDINKSVGHVKGGSVLSGDTAEEQPSGLCSEDAAGQVETTCLLELG